VVDVCDDGHVSDLPFVSDAVALTVEDLVVVGWRSIDIDIDRGFRRLEHRLRVSLGWYSRWWVSVDMLVHI
jgi:hypothetical protein